MVWLSGFLWHKLQAETLNKILLSQFIAIPISVLQMMHIIHNVQTYAPKEKMVESS